MKLKKIITLLSLCTALSISFILTGCEDKKSEKTETQAETQITTEIESETTGEATSDEDMFGGISRSEAVENVKERIGSGGQILNVEKGTSPDGLDSWVITVASVTTEDGPETLKYYSGYLFCYSEE